MATVCVVKAQHHIYSYYKQIHTYLYTRECDNMREREREREREKEREKFYYYFVVGVRHK
jgi:hypothetical protein